MNPIEKLNYVEYPSQDLEATKLFFNQVFGWTFSDFGEEYTAFSAKQAGLNGGFYRSSKASITSQGAALLVFYSPDLEAIQTKILAAGGTITKPTFHFPGGRRFHFTEPSGNELAVWSDRGVTN